MADQRSYTAGRFGLTLDGGSDMAGFVKKVDGGFAKAEVAVHNLGPDVYQKKHISTISYEPFSVEVGMGMSHSFYEWIRASFDRGHVYKSGQVVACDFDYQSKSVREFLNAYISEVTIPALDGSSKEPAYMTVKFDPETIIYSPGDGSKLSPSIQPATKKWQCSNFRIEIGDLPCARVAKLDSFTWKQGVIKDQVGAFRAPTKHPSKVEVPNLKLTISMADIDGWNAKYKSFVIDGKCSEADEMSGSITFLGPDLEEELASIDLYNIGIVSLQQAAQEANKEEVARFTVELYVERMAFNYKVYDL